MMTYKKNKIYKNINKNINKKQLNLINKLIMNKIVNYLNLNMVKLKQIE